jgi:hypothetical protein
VDRVSKNPKLRLHLPRPALIKILLIVRERSDFVLWLAMPDCISRGISYLFVVTSNFLYLIWTDLYPRQHAGVQFLFL